jgi:hypothetical protein
MMTQPADNGPCAIIVDEANETLCSKPGYEEILVRNVFGLYAVWLCKEHKESHKTFYRSNSSRLRRRSRIAQASQSRGRRPRATNQAVAS